jgi:hypothetical protein
MCSMIIIHSLSFTFSCFYKSTTVRRHQFSHNVDTHVHKSLVPVFLCDYTFYNDD